MALGAGLSACRAKGRSDSAPDGQAAREELAPGALMAYGAGGGGSGKSSHVTVFADGRVERTERGRPSPPVRVPVTSVERLAADLASTGVFAQTDGTWALSSARADGGGATLVVRDGAGRVHTYHWEWGATAPAPVERALDVGGAFASEVEREHPSPRCACVPGDPLCSCL